MLRKSWLALGGLWVVTVFYLSLMPYEPEPAFYFDGVDKLEHALAYAALMLWFSQIYTTRRGRIRLLLLLVAMGIGIEVLQRMGGYRQFEYADILANSAGVLIGWGLAHTGMGRMLERWDEHGKT